MGYPHYTSECHEYWPTVTLCGSMRFREEMLKVADQVSRIDQRIVLMPFVVVPSEQQPGELKAQLDSLHKRKIDLSKEIIVVSDESGYYGESTKGEIRYAELQGKPVRFCRVKEGVVIWGGN